MSRAISKISVLFLAALTLGSATAFSVGCDVACLTSSDCNVSPCNVCDGTCIPCSDLGNQSACENVGTGASANCIWNANLCVAITAVPISFPLERTLRRMRFSSNENRPPGL